MGAGNVAAAASFAMVHVKKRYKSRVGMMSSTQTSEVHFHTKKNRFSQFLFTKKDLSG